MIIRRVQVESWGGLRWPIDLHLHPRVNLIHAPNGTGKSTLVTAIRYALLEPAAANTGAYRPWGSEVAPRVAVEFQAADGVWKVEKIFSRRPQARLLREVRGFWEPFADDPDTVHAKTVSLVTGGEVERRHRGRESAEAQKARRGVLYVLWRDQGRAPLDRDGLELPGTAERDLAQAVGVGVVSERDRRIIEAAERRLAELLTPARREETRELALAAEQLRRVQATVGRLQEQVRVLRQWEENAESAALLLEETEELLGGARDELQQAQARLATAKEFAKKVEEADARHKSASCARGAWDQKIQNLAAERVALQAAKEELERKQAAVSAREESARSIREHLRQASDGLEEIQVMARQAADVATLARARFDLARDLGERDRMTQRLRQAEPHESIINERSTERRGISVPDAEELTGLQKLQHSLVVETMRLEGARMRVAFSADQPWQGRVELDGVESAVNLPAGSEAEWEALERADLQLDGIGRFRVERVLETSLAKQRKKVREIEQEISEGLRRWGASSLGELEGRAMQARACDEAIERAQAALQGLLPEGRESVELQLAQVEARIRTARQNHADLANEMPEVDQADALSREADRASSELAKRLEQQQRDVSALRAQFDDAEAGLPQAQEDLRAIEKDIHTATGRIQTLEDDGLTDEGRLARLAELEGAERSSEVEVLRLEAQAPALDDAVSEATASEREVQRLQAERDRYHTDLTTARARAAGIAEQGSYTELTRAEEALEVAQARYDVLKLQADARALLVTVLVEERDRQRSELFRPVEERVSRMWDRVSGGRYAAVKVEGHLRPASVVPRDYPSETPAPDALSGGEQEQLGTIIRLALAEVLVLTDPGDGQTLILDEPLPTSDSVRRRRMLELLSNPAPGLQVIVMAHDAREYAALRCDAEHDLAGLIDQARETAAAREP